MASLLETLQSLHTADGLRALVQTGGTATLTAIVFAETGLLVGFFLPGDSLLVTAGIFSASDGAGGPGLFNPWLLSLILTCAAIIGDQVGYFLGRKTGALVSKRPDSLLFKKKHLDQAHAFYDKHGALALILARFVPILRTFVPFAAGMADMEYKQFVRYNVVGGLLWVPSMVFIGYGLGNSPLANQLHKIILVVVFVSVLPIVIPMARALFRKYTGTAKAD